VIEEAEMGEEKTGSNDIMMEVAWKEQWPLTVEPGEDEDFSLKILPLMMKFL
jgi:hypothetical protein